MQKKHIFHLYSNFQQFDCFLEIFFSIWFLWQLALLLRVGSLWLIDTDKQLNQNTLDASIYPKFLTVWRMIEVHL